MRPFEYASPTGRDQVTGLLGPQWGPNAILAGGTDLLPLIKDEVVTPNRLVNIKQVEELHGVKHIPGAVLIGATTLIQDVADSALIQKDYPALARACSEAASPQIRNQATMGGNLCQRPRCWYFRNGFGLLAMKDGKSLVTAGDNRYHAILGNHGPAKFVSPSSIAPIMIAYGASVLMYGKGKHRSVALEKFFRTPEKEGEREYDLASDELVLGIILPGKPGAGVIKSAVYEVRQRRTFDWPLATAAVVLAMAGDKIEAARVVMGHVAPVPWPSLEAGEVLRGQPLNPETAAAAADAAVAKATPLSHNAYKVQLARVAVKRALLELAGAQ
jgi:xanthine dehydrogenase YagS FAD-binding subunit